MQRMLFVTFFSIFCLGIPYFERFSTFEERDFRKILDSFIKTLDQLCTISQQSVNNSIMIFQTSKMLVKQVMSRI